MFDWLRDNIDNVFVVLAAAHALAVAITNLTPTPKDDGIVATVYRWVEILAGIVSRKAKDVGAKG